MRDRKNTQMEEVKSRSFASNNSSGEKCTINIYAKSPQKSFGILKKCSNDRIDDEIRHESDTCRTCYTQYNK